MGNRRRQDETPVLVLAGVELMFFTVASMGLCFGFVLKTVLIIQRCFSYCSAYPVSRPFLLLTPPHQRGGWGGAQEAGGRDTARTADPN